MADNTLKTRLLSAHNTESYWATCQEIIKKGEVCYTVEPLSSDPDKFRISGMKIGDGINIWADLPYQTFDDTDHLYQLVTPVSTAADGTSFTTTTFLQVNDGKGGSSYSNSSSAVLTIPAATTAKAGAESATDKKIINAAADTRLTGGTTGATAAGNAYVVVNTKTVGSDGSTSAGTSNLKVNGLSSMAFKSSADFVSAVTTAAYNTDGVTIKQTKGGSASTVANFGSAVKSNITTAINLSSAPSSSSTDLPTDYAVWKAIDDLPEPMVFKGSVGTASATTSSLPTPSASNEGWTYKAITTGTSAVYHDLDGGETAANVKVGDTLISNGSKWIRVPSGDEPSGTVTSITIKANSPITIDSSAAITTSGTRTISHAAGNSSTVKVGSTAAASGLGATINVPYLQADKYGHITTAGEYTLTNVTSAEVAGVKVNNASTADYATTAGDSAKLNGVDASNFLQADDIKAGTGILVSTAAGVATVSADLATTTKYNGAAATVTAAQSTAVASRVYAVQPDKNGDLAVYIPWTDTNTKVTSVGNHYTPSSSGTFSPAAGGTTTNISDSVINYIAGLQKDAAGHITGVVSSSIKADKNTDTKVTAVGNHYTPTSSGTFSPAAGGTTTNISDGVINYIAGLQKDAAGHITGVVSSSIKADKNVNYYTTVINQTTAADGFSATVAGNNSAVKGNFSIPAATTNSAGVMTTAQVTTLNKVISATTAVEGLTKKPSGTAPISVSADNVITHDNSGVTAGVYGAAQTASFAGNVAIPSLKIDAKGHVTTAGTVNVKMPSTAGLGTSAKDVKSVAWQLNTNSGNTANDAFVSVTLNDNTVLKSNVISNTLILDGNFTS